MIGVFEALVLQFGDGIVAVESEDGDTRYLELSASTVETTPETHSGWVVTMHDVTERRRRQRRMEVLNRVLTRTLQTDDVPAAVDEPGVAGGRGDGGGGSGRR